MKRIALSIVALIAICFGGYLTWKHDKEMGIRGKMENQLARLKMDGEFRVNAKLIDTTRKLMESVEKKLSAPDYFRDRLGSRFMPDALYYRNNQAQDQWSSQTLTEVRQDTQELLWNLIITEERLRNIPEGNYQKIGDALNRSMTEEETRSLRVRHSAITDEVKEDLKKISALTFADVPQ